MSETVTISSLKTLLSFPFQGSKWQNKFLIGSLFTIGGFFIPIIPLLFVAGYGLQIMRQTIQGDQLELPEWNDWGKLALDGIRMMGIGFLFLLPGMLVMLGGYVLYFTSSFAIPLMTAFNQDSSGPSAAFPLFILLAMGIFFLSMLVGFLLYALGGIPLPAATAHFVAKDQFAAAFRVREWWPMLRANKLGYLIAFVVVFGLFGILYFGITIAYLSIILCVFIPLLAAPISFYLALISAALFGQTYRESQELLAPAGAEIEPAAA
ncbi:MAG: DUF4013 domain-containing protein [Anaerolineaceae bacterium]|nr:DUF4013 domain-containing protein [Anaerolineaceae bacterium]